MKQHHDKDGRPLCGACLKPVRPGHLYVLVAQRESHDVDVDPKVMVHLDHFEGMTTLADA